MNLIELNNANMQHIAEQAISTIKNGGIVLAPFDTVYGFICDAKNDLAIEKIFNLKERQKSKTIGVAVSSIDEMKKLAIINDGNFIKEKIPGRYTFILKAKDKYLSKYCYKGESIGVRIPDNELILQIARAFGPIAQTSANKAEQANCFSIDDVNAQFSAPELENIDLIIDDGQIDSTNPSQIWDLTQETPKQIER